MTFTNAQMMDSLRVLSQAEETGALGFAIAKNRRKLQEEVKEYSAKYDELLAKYGTDQGNGAYSIPRENLAAFEAELQPIAELTAEVTPMQVSMEVFCGGTLTSQQMYVLEWMVKEE